jgi:DNA-binding CsgD family transcriptional regulator
VIVSEHGRHVAVIDAAARGMSNREIGARLSYSPRTVDGLIEEARVWLGARNRPHAVALAVGRGLVACPAPERLRRLSAAQREVAEAVARGRTAAEAAADLGITLRAVSARIRQARRVTGCRTSSALAALVAAAAPATPVAELVAAAGGRRPDDAYRVVLRQLEDGRVEEAIDGLRQVLERRAAPSRR